MFFYIFAFSQLHKNTHPMKNVIVLFVAILCCGVAVAQKKEKIKGSKTVTVTQREINPFEAVEIEDNIEVFLVKGDVQGLEIEADDNLHEVISTEYYGNTLRITTTKDVSAFKKFSIRLTYTGTLTSVTAKHEVVLNALMALELDNITITNLDYSKSFINVKSKNFTLKMNDKTKAEANIQADSTVIEMSKNADLKALVAAQSAKIDLYQKTTASIEGDAARAQIRLDNNAELTAKKFTVKALELLAESYSTCNVLASETIGVSATGKAEVELYGTPKIDLKKFADNATLYKRNEEKRLF